jgi:hypothetical protein
MRHPLALAVAVLFLALDLRLPAQYPPGTYPPPPGTYPPGTYPPGTYPPGTGGGIPFPGRHKKKKQDDQQPLQTLYGMLRQLNDKTVVVEAEDHRILDFKRQSDTKFLKNGDAMKPDALNPGDHLIVEYRQDDEGFMTAVNITLDKEGTPAEREKASVPVEIIEPVSQSHGQGDDDRPVLHRKDAPPDQAAAPKPDAQPAPQAGTAPTAPANTPKTAPAAAPAELPPPVPPDAGIDLDHIPTSTSSHQPVDDSDSGPPRIVRGKPKPQKASDTEEVAQNSPPAPVNQPGPVAETQVSSPSLVAQSAEPPVERPTVLESGPPVDARVEKAREAVASFSETLPDYVVTEQMARFQSVTHVVSWQPLDIVSAELVYEKGKERYRNLAINGKPAKAQRMEDMPGSWSTGEFASVLLDIFSPYTATDFRYRRMSRSGGRDAFLYDFQVDREHSHWQIAMASQSILPAYRGSLWIDKETFRVLRVEMQAVRTPEEFPLDKIEMASDYEFTRIADRQFLLPVHSENLMCQRGTNMCSHNVIDFRNYHKYAGEATIEFGK